MPPACGKFSGGDGFGGMRYGFEEKPHIVARLVWWALAAACGAVAGLLAELVVTAFTESIVAALPSLRGVGHVVLYIGLALVPAGVFAAVTRAREADTSARVLGAAAFVVLVLIVGGELTGTVVLQRDHTPFYIAPEGR